MQQSNINNWFSITQNILKSGLDRKISLKSTCLSSPTIKGHHSWSSHNGVDDGESSVGSELSSAVVVQTYPALRMLYVCPRTVTPYLLGCKRLLDILPKQFIMYWAVHNFEIWNGWCRGYASRGTVVQRFSTERCARYMSVHVLHLVINVSLMWIN